MSGWLDRRPAPVVDTLPMLTRMAIPEAVEVGTELVLVPPEAASRNPYVVFLGGLAPGSRRTMAQALRTVAGILVPGIEPAELPWHKLRFEHVAAIRSRLAESLAPATANKILCAVRGVARAAFGLGLLDADTLTRILAVKAVRGSRVLRGRCLSPEELRRLFTTCDSSTPAGARNAAMLAVLYGCGLRRSEVVGLDLSDLDAARERLRVLGKGNKQREMFLGPGARRAMEAWLRARGDESGPLFLPVTRGGKIERRRMSDQAVMDLVMRLSRRAAVPDISPHDFRRSFISDLLDRVDLATVQQLAAHASASTTAMYDRRGERSRRQASEALFVPFEG